MVHLEPDDERSVVENLLRVAKPGGKIYVRAGYGRHIAQRITGWTQGANVLHAAEDSVALTVGGAPLG